MARWTFRRRRGRVEAHFEPAEVELLGSLLQQVISLLDDDTGLPDLAATDPLTASLGIGTATKVPDDPALARLLPDAYPDDPEAAGDFRRYTELGLRERKQSAAHRALATMGVVDQVVVLAHDDVLAWLGALNDVRLALGTRLGVTEQALGDDLDPDAPDYATLLVYDYLGWLQESLLRAMGDPS